MDLQEMISWMVLIINLIGSAVIVWGIILVIKDFVLTLLSEEPQSKRLMRQKLGSYLILGLEFFIAADIIRTIIRPDWNEIGMLAAIIGIRTVLSYFLGMELREKA